MCTIYTNCGSSSSQSTTTTSSANAKNVVIPSGAAGLGSAAYGTNPLTISSGTTVMWTNDDSMSHTVTSDTSIFDSGVISAGGTYSRAFNTVGTFPYHCTIHGATSMSGTIKVQ